MKIYFVSKETKINSNNYTRLLDLQFTDYDAAVNFAKSIMTPNLRMKVEEFDLLEDNLLRPTNRKPIIF